jgi:hypothetical protein
MRCMSVGVSPDQLCALQMRYRVHCKERKRVRKERGARGEGGQAPSVNSTRHCLPHDGCQALEAIKECMASDDGEERRRVKVTVRGSR